jgi:nitrogenase molybdenum-iron protein alpha/beta subunit
MKSALANVGENDASILAGRLETAGQSNDTAYITQNTEEFLQALEALIAKHTPDVVTSQTEAVEEDIAFLREQLKIIKEACEGYDDDAAYATLNKLKEKPWNPETLAMLEEIKDTLFVYSDFEKAAQLAEDLGRR